MNYSLKDQHCQRFCLSTYGHVDGRHALCSQARSGGNAPSPCARAFISCRYPRPGFTVDAAIVASPHEGKEAQILLVKRKKPPCQASHPTCQHSSDQQNLKLQEVDSCEYRECSLSLRQFEGKNQRDISVNNCQSRESHESIV